MSGTRSPFQKAPATDKHAVIVSHGQPSDPGPAEVTLAQLTAKVAALMPDWTLASATLAAPGTLDSVMAETGPGALVYPLFMTDGWFTLTNLPKRLGNKSASVMSPLGNDPILPDLACAWLNRELDLRSWQARDTCLIIAAHGSGKSRNPSRDTEKFARALNDQIGFSEMRIGFIEEPPFLGDVVFDVGQQCICLPFFATSGEHVTDDLPEALDLAGFSGVRLDPIGLHPEIPTLIAKALSAEEKNKVAV